MTPHKEDYLIEIYRLGGAEQLVGNKQIAQAMDVAPASVSEMLAKLSRDGLIEYTAYQGTRLTSLGLQIALKLVRGHRLWEVFLMRHLGYSWREAHEDAELLEHITPPRLTERLDKFLNYPAYCPHGSAIPGSDGSVNHLSLLALDQLQAGDYSTVRQVIEEIELLDYLESLGIAIGSEFSVVTIAPYEGPITLKINKKQIQISYKAAGQILVDPPGRP